MKKIKYSLKSFLILIPFFLIALVTGCEIQSGDIEDNRIMNLAGDWKFNIGDDEEWSKPEFNDENWETIKAPVSWENEGFFGYNGFAWYRKNFSISSTLKGKSLYLHLGYVDDVDATYINGHLVGYSGSFPPDYQSAYSAYRKYSIPEQYINYDGNNVIAVRVYDSQQEGGIVAGNIGFYSEGDKPVCDINLEGLWKFSTNDSSAWMNISFDDSGWDNIIVPGMWESQGFRDYDGFAWYRRSFTIDENLASQKLVLLAGRIDDFDEVYLNEVKIGTTGNIVDEQLSTDLSNLGDFYRQARGYFVPDGLLKPGKKNTIAIRVYDGFKDGGIYEGPVGLITQKKYSQFWREKKKSEFF
ncbi:MAG: beta galactosidase jelly roll domain-containing protein [Ignavibacteriales bacterium]|nr:MAG: beta galactosidase jelly roll domain-containing protein [Ignavibacteriales bacterium]